MSAAGGAPPKLDFMTAGIIRGLVKSIEVDNIHRAVGELPRNEAHARQMLDHKAANKVFVIVDLWRRFIRPPAFAAYAAEHTAVARRGMELVRASAPPGADPATYVRSRINAGIDMYLQYGTRMDEDGSVRANRREVADFLMHLLYPSWGRRRHALTTFGRRVTSRRTSSGKRRSGSSGRRTSSGKRRSGSSGRRGTGSH